MSASRSWGDTGAIDDASDDVAADGVDRAGSSEDDGLETLSINIAPKPYIVGSLAPKSLKHMSPLRVRESMMLTKMMSVIISDLSACLKP